MNGRERGLKLRLRQQRETARNRTRRQRGPRYYTFADAFGCMPSHPNFNVRRRDAWLSSQK